MSFGEIIAAARRRAGLQQKELAARLIKEDGAPVSAQYWSDIELGRRNPPAGRILRQLARELGLPGDYVFFLAGELPEDLQDGSYEPERVEAAFRAFREALGKVEPGSG